MKTDKHFHAPNAPMVFPEGVARVRKEDVNLPRRGAIRFQIGLIFAMTLTYVALEWLWPAPQEFVPPPELLTEPHVFFVMEPPEVAPEAKAPADPSPRTLAAAVVPVESVAPKLTPPAVEAPPVSDPLPNATPANPGGQAAPSGPYHMLRAEELPVFPGCEKVSKEERLTCFQQQLHKHILRTFRYPETAVATGQQGRVMVEFVIENNGSVGDIRLRGPSPVLEKEASRIIERLPRMLPARVQGLPVAVRYTVPISFILN